VASGLVGIDIVESAGAANFGGLEHFVWPAVGWANPKAATVAIPPANARQNRRMKFLLDRD
jgi:hypothetical protein